MTKIQDNLIKLQCKECKHINYWTKKNKKKVEKNLKPKSTVNGAESIRRTRRLRNKNLLFSLFDLLVSETAGHLLYAICHGGIV